MEDRAENFAPTFVGRVRGKRDAERAPQFTVQKRERSVAHLQPNDVMRAFEFAAEMLCQFRLADATHPRDANDGDLLAPFQRGAHVVFDFTASDVVRGARGRWRAAFGRMRRGRYVLMQFADVRDITADNVALG